jgi:hypothetical protein
MEQTMEREDVALIDLGAASVETKGPGFGGVDTEGLQNIAGGLSDD